ncbi:hypothetical protein Q5741_02815 [Paenibacillus sp. JX-17]|uniref:ATP-binding protein n=1 Tax=Paenibacillus lacisoli TaxID=3064525 RepID=A0ABT9C7V9_9BACL|nr:hypothetical protein [Paenibacillus sp. JX-17]MDO7905343.1 hypothetical protein [Paenibacillus sp. JX-17]
MLPCLNKNSLKLLAGTADQRYQFSKAYFRNTHFPQVMHRYFQNQLTGEVSENELFQELTEIDASGNRVYFIFGSTGSGKSELLCWLKDHWETQGIERPVVRISRTELNPQVLIKKCYDALGIQTDIEINENRWNILLSKPITIINQIVWSTLAEMFHSDEDIVPCALLLRPIVEQNVTKFTKQIERGNIKSPLELISQQQFEELLSKTTLQLSMDYGRVKQSLIKKLDHFLFEGKEISSLFRKLSNIIKERNIRPLLLIDDLVQSVNIYASDILDQLITLEEGNWDVVVGLTPGSLLDSTKGRDLTQRIQTLDTIDDRVRKLWLSDESGKAFYNLNIEQAVPYMSKYLNELKGAEGYTCSMNCPNYGNCMNLIPVSGQNLIDEKQVCLLPFNEPMIRRMYRAIPVGKGKLRYMILNTKEILRAFYKKKGTKLQTVQPFISREKFAEHSDLTVKSIAEWYGSEQEDTITLPGYLLKKFDAGDDSITVKLYNIHQLDQDSKPMVTQVNYSHPTENIVRDWVEGENVNVELLESVRLGIASIVHEVVKATSIQRPFTSKLSSSVQRKEVENRTRYPISFDSSGDGIYIKRSYPVLEIVNLQQEKPSERARTFNKIANQIETAMWVYQTETIGESWKEELTLELGLPLPYIALCLKQWVGKWAELSQFTWCQHLKSPFNNQVKEISEQFYQDWFLLRDNMIDPVQETLQNTIDFEKWILAFAPRKKLEQYSISDHSINSFFNVLKNDFMEYKKKLESESKKIKLEYQKYVTYLESVKHPDHASILIEINKIKDHDTIEEYFSLGKLERFIQESGLESRYAETLALREEIDQLVEKTQHLDRHLERIFFELTGTTVETKIKIVIGWSQLEDRIKQWESLNEGFAQIHQTFLKTPIHVVKQIINSRISNAEAEQVRTLWEYLYKTYQSMRDAHIIDDALLSHLETWEIIDFYEVKKQVDELEKRLVEVDVIIGKLQLDLSTESLTVKEIMERIDKQTDIRPAVRKQVYKLFNQGSSVLPQKQWRKLVNDFSVQFPNLFESVELQMVIKKVD